jgi:hypothetical protein
MPSSGIGERLYPNPADPTYFPEAYEPGVAAEPPLLPRQQRRQRGALRGLVIALVLIALVAAFGWLLRDTIRGIISPPPPEPTVVAITDGNLAALGSPTAPTSAALPNALATVTPTPAAASTATPRPQRAEAEATLVPAAGQTTEPDRDISAQTRPLLDLLPTQEQVPAGMILSDEAERSKADVVQALGGTDEAAQHLEDWGWSGNAYRDFIVPDGGQPPPTGTTFINASVHRFADAASAANALVFFSDQVILEQGLQEVEAPAIGESARLLQGSPNGVPLAILYVQNGPIMYRIGGSTSAAEGDPTTDVLSVATAIMPSDAAGG